MSIKNIVGTVKLLCRFFSFLFLFFFSFVHLRFELQLKTDNWIRTDYALDYALLQTLRAPIKFSLVLYFEFMSWISLSHRFSEFEQIRHWGLHFYLKHRGHLYTLLSFFTLWISFTNRHLNIAPRFSFSLVYLCFDFLLTAHNWRKWKRVFLTCPCHNIYRDEAVGLKSCKNTWKVTIFVKMWNLGQYRENLILCQ